MLAGFVKVFFDRRK
jgi:hypothetical protein